MFRSLFRKSASSPKTTSGKTRQPRLEALEGRYVQAVFAVVPAYDVANNVKTFHNIADVLETGKVKSGDTIQIEPGATPGTLGNANIPNVTNVTIQGNPSVGPTESDPIVLSNIDIDAAAAGLTFRNVHLVNIEDTLNVDANATFDHVVFDNYFQGIGISFNSTTAAVVRSSILTDFNPSTSASSAPFIDVIPAANGHNLFQNNRIANTLSHALMRFSNTTTQVADDKVIGNTFVGDANNNGGAGGMLGVNGKVNGLTVQDNNFIDVDNQSVAIFVSDESYNVVLNRNTITMPNDTNITAITIFGGTAGVSVEILNNRINLGGNGTGLDLNPGNGAYSVKVEGNDFNHAKIGVHSNGINLANVDLGGGALGSRGGNNFRGYTAATSVFDGAIVMQGPAAGALSAKFNLFGVANAENVVFDANDDAMRGNADVSGALKSNEAFVQALYTRFLRRAGDLAVATDAGNWVNKLANGATAASVVNGIARSTQAFNILVNDLYAKILQRAPTATERNNTVDLLKSNKLTFEGLNAKLYASLEYQKTHPSTASYVSGLYQDLLGRAPTAAQLNAQIKAVNTSGRLAVAKTLLAGTEYRTRTVKGFFYDLLHRNTAPTATEVSNLVTTKLSVFDLELQLAATKEFKLKG